MNIFSVMNGANTAVSDIFEQQLAQQILVSEKKRVTILAMIFIFLVLEFLTMVYCFPAFLPKEFSHQIYGLPFWSWFCLLLVFAAIYEGVLRIVIDYVIKTEKKVSAIHRYFNVFEETF